MKLWGLKEGTYVFQLKVASVDQAETTANLTVTVLSTKQTEGEGASGEAASGATRLC